MSQPAAREDTNPRQFREVIIEITAVRHAQKGIPDGSKNGQREKNRLAECNAVKDRKVLQFEQYFDYQIDGVFQFRL